MHSGSPLHHRTALLTKCVPFVTLLLAGGVFSAFSQDWFNSPGLAKARYRNGEETLRAFEPVSAMTRHSIVKFNVNGETVALGGVVDTNGLVLTKASELKPGKLTCWLATEEEVGAEVLSTDDEEDVALVRVHAEGLKPLKWASEPVSLGEWAITPGIAETPHAVGIVSALPRKIRPQRALMGVRFEFDSPSPRIAEILRGMGAERAGFKKGDVIIALNEIAVTNRAQVVDMVSDQRAGQTLKLRVQRGDKQIEAEVELMVPKFVGNNESSEAERPSAQLSGELSRRAAGFESAIEHDTVLPPWLCGGPLVNLEGQAIGLNIARASRVTTYALSAELVKRILVSLESKVSLPPADL